MYILLATPLSMNGVHSQLFTLLYATSQTTYDLQLMPFWKLVNDSSTHCKKKQKTRLNHHLQYKKKQKQVIESPPNYIRYLHPPHTYFNPLSTENLIAKSKLRLFPKNGRHIYSRRWRGAERANNNFYVCEDR